MSAFPGLALESLADRRDCVPRGEPVERPAEARRQEPSLLGIGESFRAAPEDRLAEVRAPQVLVLAPVVEPGAPDPCGQGLLGDARDGDVVVALELVQRAPARVAVEQLVRSFADLRDDDTRVPSEPRDEIDGHTHWIGDRLVLEPDHRRQEIHQVIDRERELVVIRTHQVGHPARVVELVRIRRVLSGVADRERLHRRGLALREERRVGAGIDPT